MRIAGFNIVRTDDVIVSSTAIKNAITQEQQDQFKARWGQLPPVSDLGAYRPFDPERDFCPAGAENGFRPDVFKLDVLESGTNNCLVYPPWEDAEGMASLATTIARLPADVTLWLRTEPGTGDARMQQLSALNFDCKAHVLIVDAHLAPEREGALYVRAGRVWTDDQWPQARQVIRRAIDCGCVVLRRPADLVAWATTSAEA